MKKKEQLTKRSLSGCSGEFSVKAQGVLFA
jgi:hypothetical protein